MNIEENLETLFSLRDKVIVLTGAAGGIGETLAKGLAAAGGEMALCDINIEGVKLLSEKIIQAGGKSVAYSLDMAKIDGIKPFVDLVIKDKGKIDVLINCAGINKRENFIDVEEEMYDRIMDVNLKGIYFLSQETAKHMKKAGKGSIINFTSHNAVQMLGGCSVYGAAKSALAALTRSMAVEWAEYGIRANAIAPGHIETPLTSKAIWQDPDKREYVLSRIAMKRPGVPADLLGLTILLASDASSYMSGLQYHVDGGCIAGGTPWTIEAKE